jgi:hypothetical protein
MKILPKCEYHASMPHDFVCPIPLFFNEEKLRNFHLFLLDSILYSR